MLVWMTRNKMEAKQIDTINSKTLKFQTIFKTDSIAIGVGLYSWQENKPNKAKYNIYEEQNLPWQTKEPSLLSLLLFPLLLMSTLELDVLGYVFCLL